jgi:hypothetical protein
MFSLQKKQSTQTVLFGIAFLVILTAAQFFSSLLLRITPVTFGRAGDYAVFLVNGQVYFGSLVRETQQSLVMTDIYYLKSARPLVTQDDLEVQTDTSLVKLGNELHGPEDRMEINRAQVLFLEKLRPDGTVAKAISQYRSQREQAK